ncbi:glycosyltransferase [Pandoraea anapnoica]|uniref:Glycosyltransferase n=1 Tax=Pandoraea anapnoica TaxID=2508301 RepID=A0A5E4ZYW4_9BURK|nr:glycosyltransferase family 4 protein [Pandoraea anapnoica]VVE65988.1 glycosyltransferase [Pandoraea anapnoica]
MKILIVSQYFWPENFRINDLTAALVERGHQVTVLTGYPNYPDGKIFDEFRANPGGFSQYEGAEVIRVPLLPRGNGALRLMLNYASFVVTGMFIAPFKLRGRKFDRIFVYETSPITVGLPSSVLRWVKRAPVAFWVLDLWPETLRAVGVIKSERVLGWVGKLVTFIYNRCDVILAQSRSFIPAIRRHAGESARVELLPSWAESLFDDAENVSVAPELVPFDGKFKIVFAGNIGEAQDFPAILDAAYALRERTDIQWVIVGDGRNAAWVASEIETRGLSSTVSMLGRFPLDRMPSFYAGADALLVTLRSDEIFAMTIPGKVQSYLAAGKPILGMLDGEGALVIEDAKAGYACSAGNGEALATLACRLADDGAAQRDAMGERGRAYYRANFQRDTVIQRLEDMLADLTLKSR